MPLRILMYPARIPVSSVILIMPGAQDRLSPSVDWEWKLNFEFGRIVAMSKTRIAKLTIFP